MALLIHLMPGRHTGPEEHPWQESLQKLEKREIDLAILPLRTVPARFEARRLYDEDFVVARCARVARLRAHRRSPHSAGRNTLLVSPRRRSPAASSINTLGKRGLSAPHCHDRADNHGGRLITLRARRPHHLPLIDCGIAVPSHRAIRSRIRAAFVELPLQRKSDVIQAVATKAAMMDAGVAWLMERVVEVAGSGRSFRYPP